MKTGLGWVADIPDHWKIVPLNTVARMGTGHTPDKLRPDYWVDCTIPWVTLTDASRHGDSIRPILDTEQKISNLGLMNSAAILHPAGTVFLSRTASVGYSAMMGVPMATTQDFVTWTPGPELDSSYLLLLLRAMSEEWRRLAYGSTHLTVYMPDLEALRIPLPPLVEQRAISQFLVSEIQRIDELRKFRKMQIEALGEMRQAQLAISINDLIRQYGTVPLRRVTSSIQQGWSPQCDEVAAEPGEWGVLRTSAVSSGEFRATENKRLPPKTEPVERYRVIDGDIVMTRGSGTSRYVGVAVEAKTNSRKLLLSDLLYRIRLISGWSSKFVALSLRSDPVRSATSLLFRGQSGQTIKLRLEDVKAIDIPAVPCELQQPIADKLESENDLIAEAQNSILSSVALLTERRDSMTRGVVSGQVGLPIASEAGS